MDKRYTNLASPAVAVVVLWIIGVAQASGAGTPASSQVQLPANTPTPGQVQSSLPTTPQQPQPKAGPEFNPPAAAPSEVAPGGPTVPVESFEITGATAFPDAVLQAQVATFLHRQLTLAELYQAADALTRFYQSHGYGVARATVPQQEFSGGKVQLEVVEGRLGKVSVEGESRIRRRVIEKTVSGFKSGDVYTDAAMDRSVMLANDLPGVQVQATLEPGADFGTTDLIYKAVDQPDVSGQFSVDDYGREDVGRVRFNASADVASPTGSGDRLVAQITHSEHNLLNFGGLTYSLPLGPPGGTFTADYNQSEYRVAGGAFTLLGVRGRSDNAGASYQYPEIRGRYTNSYWGVGLQHAGSATLAGGQVVSSANLNTGQLTAFYTHSHDDGSYYSLSGTFASNARKNHGTTPNAERARLELDGNYVQPFADNWLFIGRGAGEWSPDPLPDSEKYSLGGQDNVSGFLSAEQRGDSALFVSGEVQHSLGADRAFALGGFLDSGRVWLKQFNAFQSSKPTPGAAATLTAVGLEMTWQPPSRRWTARLQWAWAIGGYQPSDGDEGGHIWFTLGMNYGGGVVAGTTSAN